MLGIPYLKVNGIPNPPAVRLAYMATLAERLQSAINKNKGLTKAGLSRACSISPPSVNDWFTGKTKSISSPHLHAAATYLGVSAQWLATGAGSADQDHSGSLRTEDQRATYVANRPDVIDVPLMNAAGSMGLGKPAPDHDSVVDVLRLSRDWVHSNLKSISSPANLAALSAYGDSMEPTFTDGDILMVDRGVSVIRLDAVYVLQLHGDLFIKRVQRRITDGAIIIKSDNPIYEPAIISNGERESLSVLGRVVWAWNGRRL
jgi:phage repressor protein C with HTH and peptisase S24 domain